MTGFLTTYDGALWQLPPLLSWEILQTDGDGCGSAQVTFVYEPKRLSVLKNGAFLRLEDTATRFYGVVDEVSARLGEDGRTVTLCCRTLQALLMDNELRATRFSAASLSDVLQRFVYPFGVAKVIPASMGQVSKFAVETGNTAWQALCGFCRHAGGGEPRFTADGTLVFGEEDGILTLDESKISSAEVRRCAYGLIGRQIVVSAGYEDVEIEEREALLLRGGKQKVAMRMGSTVKADWRTAAQRVGESAREEETITLLVVGDLSAVPTQRVSCSLPQMGIAGTYRLRRVKTECSLLHGITTELTLEGGCTDVAV